VNNLDASKGNKLSALELALILIVPLCSIFISKSLFIQLQSVSVFVGCILVVSKYGWKRDSSFMSSFLLFIFFYGTVIGSCYMILGNNDAYKMIQYSFLSLSSYVGYKTGFIVAQKNNLFYFIIIFILVDLLLFYALFLDSDKGRTSIGTSNLFPVLLIVFIDLKSIASKKYRFLIIGLFLTAVLACLTSGMRSSLGTMAISFGLVFLYRFQFRSLLRLLKYVMICLLFLGVLVVFTPENIKNSLITNVDNVVYRFETTLFSEEGVQLDSSSSNGGRKVEAESAMDEFNENSGLHIITGYGHGFVYFDRMQEKVKAHVHITYVAYYIRYGIIGLIFLTVLYFVSLANTIKLFFKPRSLSNAILFGLWLSVLQILFISLIAASLISIIHWVIIGLAFGFQYYINSYKSSLDELHTN
jgi:hypothetical protein